MQFINNAIGGQPVVAAVVCYPESVVRSPKAVRDPQPQYGAHLLHVTIFFPAADSRRISCIYEIKHKVASRLVLYLLPFAAAHLAHMTAEIFSKRGEAAGAENHTHGPAPKKKGNIFMHFQLNRKWKSRSRKKADERAAIITLFLEDRGCPNGTHMSLCFLFPPLGRGVGGCFFRRAANDANGLNCVLSSILVQTELLFIHSPEWER